MAFIVEDGTGVIGANAYVTRQTVTDYLTERNRSTENGWGAGSQPLQEAAVIAATDYIEVRFSERFLGIKEFPEKPQGLSFPRLAVYDRDGNVVKGVPLRLKQAASEYAVRAFLAKLLPDPAVDATGRVIVEKTDKVGPIEETRRYEEGGALTQLLRPYPAADKLLTPFLVPAGLATR